MPIFNGNNGNNTINGSNGDDIIFGNGGDDILRGRGGFDTIFGGEGNDDIDGGTGNDVLHGEAGDDLLAGDDGNDRLTGGAGNDTINGGSGTDTAVYSGSIFEYSFSQSGIYLTVSHNGGAGADGTDVVNRVERLEFTDVVIDLTQNNAPIARDDAAATDEDAGIYSSGDASVLDNDFDFEGNMTVIQAIIAGAYGTLTMNSDGTYSYELNAGAQALAQGEVVQDSFSYTVTDGSLSDTANLVITITGLNDAPVAEADSASTTENAAIFVDVLANDSDVDNGAVITLIAASAPAGQGTASVVGDQVQFDPGTDFDDLAAGQTEEVVVSYDIEDEHGATATGTVTIIVTGTNDGPVANPDSGTTHENAVLTVDVIANDTDVDNGAVLTIVSASVTPGEGSVTIVDNKLRYDPGNDLDYLADGESFLVVVNYTMQDEHGVQSSSTLSITVQGETDGTINGTEGDDTLTGTPNDDSIFARGGDDIVFAQAGNDFVDGGDGADTLNGEGGNDSIEGGNDNDVLSGGDGFDNLDGEAGDDTLSGGNDGDTLSGGDGEDQLSGDAGSDVLQGDADDDQLSGGADDDILGGGDGDDTMDGGGGADFLTDLVGVNSFTGGLGDDEIVAGSADGAQTIDGGDGNDTIRHYYRHSASTITTGLGSDTIEIAHADQGTAAITVTDFTTGAGGDIFRLEGDDGALLGLLAGWDGSSNPFGSGFLRLEQDDADTLLQWDQDGAAGGENWETLVVFENTVVANFTADNFAPAYPPDGSAPAGQTITGTDAGQTLIGTIGNDTINALGGNDNVFGRAGDDFIDGGNGLDFLSGEAGNDVIEGGNDDDTISGDTGDDQLSGEAGNDSLFGEIGNDQASGGDGADFLSGGGGNDVLAGGNHADILAGGDGDDDLDGDDGDDFLADSGGVNSLSGGLGADLIVSTSADGAHTIDGGGDNDTIRHYYRHFASTITTGLGSDTIEIAHANIGTAAIIVTDFTAGAGGDMFKLDGDDGGLLSLLVGWDSGSNPFGAGFLRLEQDGTDTLLQWDPDGAAGGENWETLAVFENTEADDFTADNFVPGYDPGGGEPEGETFTGTAGDDTLVGTAGDDVINALGGNDAGFGLAGDDLIVGGDGFDNLNGGDDNDVIQAGNQDDSLSGGEGNDQLFGEAGDDAAFGEDGDDQVSGGDGFDVLTGDAGADVIAGGNDDDFLSGGEHNDSLAGEAGADSLDGGDGDDVLSGGSGFDVLTGGIGADIFDYQSASNGPDEVTDFVSGTDQIRVSASGFGGGLTAGGSVSLVSGSNPTASGAGGQFLFDTDDGRLLWDADGTGTGAALLVATLSSLPSLAASDFVVI